MVSNGSKSTKRHKGSLEYSFYYRFSGIKQRSRNTPGNRDYRFYKDRKCEWVSFKQFKEDMWATFVEHVQRHGKHNTTLERINNDLGYSKENCRWATRQEQAKNRKDTVFITYENETMCINDWAKKLGCARITLLRRIFKYKWPVEKAFTSPFISHVGLSKNMKYE